MNERITHIGGLIGGRPTIRGLRFGVHHVLGQLAGGMTPSEIVEDHPELKPEDIYACLAHAAEVIGRPPASD
jgi:uncharacterized protein (DUF433 family)